MNMREFVVHLPDEDYERLQQTASTFGLEVSAAARLLLSGVYLPLPPAPLPMPAPLGDPFASLLLGFKPVMKQLLRVAVIAGQATCPSCAQKLTGDDVDKEHCGRCGVALLDEGAAP